MVVAVVGKHVEAHAAEHLLRIRCVAARKNPGQLHQRVIVERGRAPIHLKDRCGAQHVAADARISAFLAVKPAHGKVSTAPPGGHEPCLWYGNAARGRTVHVFFFHQPHLRHVARCGELDDPSVCHDLGTRAAGAAAHLEEGIQIADLLAVQQRPALLRKVIQIAQGCFLMHIPRRAIGQRAHAGSADNRQTLQRRHVCRGKPPAFEHTTHEQSAPCVGQAVRKDAPQTMKCARGRDKHLFLHRQGERADGEAAFQPRIAVCEGHAAVGGFSQRSDESVVQIHIHLTFVHGVPPQCCRIPPA